MRESPEDEQMITADDFFQLGLPMDQNGGLRFTRHASSMFTRCLDQLSLPPNASKIPAGKFSRDSDAYPPARLGSHPISGRFSDKSENKAYLQLWTFLKSPIIQNLNAASIEAWRRVVDGLADKEKDIVNAIGEYGKANGQQISFEKILSIVLEDFGGNKFLRRRPVIGLRVIRTEKHTSQGMTFITGTCDTLGVLKYRKNMRFDVYRGGELHRYNLLAQALQQKGRQVSPNTPIEGVTHILFHAMNDVETGDLILPLTEQHLYDAL